MDDRRSRPRLTVSLDAVWDSITGRKCAKITNLSEGGCYLDTVGETLAGEIVCFRVSMPDDDWLYLEGEVRHLAPGLGFGVRFVDLNAEQEEKIELLVEQASEASRNETCLFADLIQE